MVAKSFAYEPDAITVKSGDVRTLVLHVKDIPHDFTVKELDIHVHGGADGTVRQTITFDQPGTYEFYCSIAGHKQAARKFLLDLDIGRIGKRAKIIQPLVNELAKIYRRRSDLEMTGVHA